MHSKQHFVPDCKCTVLEAIPPEKQYLSSLCLALLGTWSRHQGGGGVEMRDAGSVAGMTLAAACPCHHWRTWRQPADGIGMEGGERMSWKCCWVGLQPVLEEKVFDMLEQGGDAKPTEGPDQLYQRGCAPCTPPTHGLSLPRSSPTHPEQTSDCSVR